MMPLTIAKPGEKNLIRRIIGNHQTCKHLAELGFVEGQEITVISVLGGNMILAIKDSRVAIDKIIASKIMI